jgi:tetratricopeptide (TPR) repeat protein/DNA-binding MarR family transcriptional regulator
MVTKNSKFSLSIDKKILLHIAKYSKYEFQYEVPFELSQEGIAQAIGIRRDNVPRTMKSLKNEDLIFEKVLRVEGVYRKRKVYFLTEKGQDYTKKLTSKVLKSITSIKMKSGEVVTKQISKILEDPSLTRALSRKITLMDLLKEMPAGEPLDWDVFITTLKTQPPSTDPKKESSAMDPGIKTEFEDIDEESFKTDVREFGKSKKFIDYTETAPAPRTFVGREGEVKKIKSWVDSEDYKIIVIFGIPGIGKTTLAWKIVDDYRNKKHLFWYRFHRWDTIRHTLVSLSDFLNATNRRRLKLYLSSNPSIDLYEISKMLEDELKGANILLVFDDFQRVQENIAELFSLLIEVLARIDGVEVMVVGRRIIPFYDRSEVLVKHLVAELQLDGLDEENSKKLLKIKIKDQEVFQKIYDLTKGHPLFLELISSLKDIKDLKNIKRYIYEEIFSKLVGVEKTLLNIISVYRYPVSANAFFIDDQVSYETLDELVDRNLVQEISYDEYDVHDLIREFFYIRLPPKIKRRYHIEAANYYIEEGSTIGSIEAQYHLISANEYEKAIKLAISNGTEIITKGYLEEFLSILDEFDVDNTPEDYWAEIMLLKAETLTITGDWDTALGYYNQALVLCEKMNKPEVEATARRKIGHIRRKRSELDDAIVSYNKSLKISNKIKDILGTADSYRGLGAVYGIKGEFDKAIEHLERSLSDSKKVENFQVMGRTYIDLGTVFTNKGELDRAVEFHEKALQVLEQTGDIYERARVLTNLGIVYTDKGDLEKALKYFEECIKISDMAGDIRQMGYGLISASEVYIKNENFELAKEYLDESLEIFEKVGEKFKISTVYNNYGTIAKLEKDWDKASEYYNKSIKILESLDIPYYLAKVYFDYGKMYKAKKDKANADKYFKRAQVIFKKLGVEFKGD